MVLAPCTAVTTTRAPAGFERDVLQQRSFVIGAAVAAILAGIVAFAIGLAQATDTHARGDAPASSRHS